jgi:hypothetical protein
MCDCNKKIETNQISNAKSIVKRLWEKSQFEEKILYIKKINKQV